MTQRKGYDYDPQFPNRPLHPDFKLLSDLLTSYDDDNVEAKLENMGGVDVDSIFYMAMHRAALADERMVEQDTVSKLAAAWVDGFMLAAQFTREKLFSLEDEVTKDGGRRRGER